MDHYLVSGDEINKEIRKEKVSSERENGGETTKRHQRLTDRIIILTM